MLIGNVKLNNFPVLLAPMEDVSDSSFRRICKRQGADLVFTEFISSEGLIRGAKKSFDKLEIFEEERPIGIQIFGAEYESMNRSIDIVKDFKPDIIDINYGCPVKKVVCKGAGAGILKDIDKMVSLTSQMVKRTDIPITVKTRLGWDENSIKIVEVAERLQDVGIKAISIHGRTRKQMYKGEADWNKIAKVKNNPRLKIPVFANGDIDTAQKAKYIRDSLGLDGVMIGRAAIGFPWIFKIIKNHLLLSQATDKIKINEIIEIMKEHLSLSIESKGEKRAIIEMRKHYSNYFKGFHNFKQHKIELMKLIDKDSVVAKLDDILCNYSSLK